MIGPHIFLSSSISLWQKNASTPGKVRASEASIDKILAHGRVLKTSARYSSPSCFGISSKYFASPVNHIKKKMKNLNYIGSHSFDVINAIFF